MKRTSAVACALAFAALALGSAAAPAAGIRFGPGQTCSGPNWGPADPAAPYMYPGGQNTIGVATGNGAGVDIGSECGGGLGRISASEGGVYAEDYTEGDVIANAYEQQVENTLQDVGILASPGGDCDGDGRSERDEDCDTLLLTL